MDTISQTDRAELIGLAHEAVEAEVSGRPAPPVTNATGLLAERRGCFVTLKNSGRLRGCIGTFQPRMPLGEQIIEMGTAAAQDPRFTADPITVAELAQLSLEVSVLSPLTETDEPEQLQIGTHGIFIVRGMRSGCFLPEVATEMGWGAREFLDYCCTGKAGLHPGAWKEPETRVYLFASEKFGHEPA